MRVKKSAMRVPSDIRRQSTIEQVQLICIDSSIHQAAKRETNQNKMDIRSDEKKEKLK